MVRKYCISPRSFRSDLAGSIRSRWMEILYQPRNHLTPTPRNPPTLRAGLSRSFHYPITRQGSLRASRPQGCGHGLWRQPELCRCRSAPEQVNRSEDWLPWSGRSLLSSWGRFEKFTLISAYTQITTDRRSHHNPPANAHLADSAIHGGLHADRARKCLICEAR